MKNNKKLSDALGSIDEKYIDEYVNGQGTVSRRPMIWRTVIAASVAVTLLVGAAVGIPAAFRGNTELGDYTEPTLAPGGTLSEIAAGEYAIKWESITDAAGNSVLHAATAGQIPQDDLNKALFGASASITESSAEMMLINWSSIISNAKQSTSPDELIFIGTPVSHDVYAWDEETTINGEGWVVEYDVASGTTALKEVYECEPYQATRRTVVQLYGIRIDEILKENNTTGYKVGDIIYFYSERASIIEDLAKTPVNDMSIHGGELGWETSKVVTEIAIAPSIPDNDMSINWGETAAEQTAVLPSTPKPAVESGAYIPADTTTAALPFIPTTEIADETIPEIDYNGDGKVDELDKAVDNQVNTSSSSSQRMYVAHVTTRDVAEIVSTSGLVPEQLWTSAHSCTAEEYRSGRFPNDMSNMQ